MSFGYVFALLPLLSLDSESVFGQGSFLRHIPFLELSTPEEYLASVAPVAVTDDVKTAEVGDVDVEESAGTVGLDEETATEETPLLPAAAP
jgi:hypothetical protein